MKVILTQDLKNLGKKWDIVEVKPGYFRNYLGPNVLAVMPTVATLTEAQKHIEERAKKVEELNKEANEIKAILEEKTFEFVRKITKSGSLYAALHTKDIVETIKEQAKLEIEPKKVIIASEIKSVGDHVVDLQLTEQVVVKLKIKVVAEEA